MEIDIYVLFIIAWFIFKALRAVRAQAASAESPVLPNYIPREYRILKSAGKMTSSFSRQASSNIYSFAWAAPVYALQEKPADE